MNRRLREWHNAPLLSMVANTVVGSTVVVGVLVVCVVVLPGRGYAQGTPPAGNQPALLPENPTSPLDFQSMPMGAPKAAPKAAASAPKASAKAAAAPVTGYSGGDNVSPERVRHRGAVPKFHVVRKGDSLWRLCDYYYGDSWAWPQLWANNSTITNPHWIYPGDKIRMLDPSATSDVQPQGAGFRVLAGSRTTTARGPISLRQNAYIDDQQLKASGVIAGSRHENRMLSLFQEVYLKGNDNFKPRVGQVFTVYKVKKKLGPSKRKLGHVVEILGSVRIKRTPKDKYSTAEIVEAFNVIERGARVGPLRRTLRRLPARPAKKDLSARVVDFLGTSRFGSHDQLVFLDRGRKDGVRNGNRFLVMRRGDGNRQLYQDREKDNPKYPREPVAEVTVLDVRENASVGIISKANCEIRRGEYVRMRRGY